MRPIHTLALLFAVVTPAAGRDLTLWYTQPARKGMKEALPIGNGRMGALVCADPQAERLVLNESSLWTGDEQTADGNYDRMGSYLLLGELRVALPGHQDATDYRRELNIADSVAATRYESGGVHYRREYFCSHADQVLVVRFTADRPGSHTGTLELRGVHDEKTATDGDGLGFSGALPNGLQYEARLRVLHDGGSVSVAGCLSLLPRPAKIPAAGSRFPSPGGYPGTHVPGPANPPHGRR